LEVRGIETWVVVINQKLTVEFELIRLLFENQILIEPVEKVRFGLKCHFVLAEHIITRLHLSFAATRLVQIKDGSVVVKVCVVFFKRIRVPS